MKRIFAIALLVGSASVASAQAVAPLPQKDAGVATLIGVIVPGGGQPYAEETGRGLAFMLATAGSIAAGAALSTNGTPDIFLPGAPSLGIPASTYPGTAANRMPLTLGIIAGTAIWIWGALDAGPAAMRANAKRSRVSLVPSHGGVGIRVGF